MQWLSHACDTPSKCIDWSSEPWLTVTTRMRSTCGLSTTPLLLLLPPPPAGLAAALEAKRLSCERAPCTPLSSASSCRGGDGVSLARRPWRAHAAVVNGCSLQASPCCRCYMGSRGHRVDVRSACQVCILSGSGLCAQYTTKSLGCQLRHATVHHMP